MSPQEQCSSGGGAADDVAPTAGGGGGATDLQALVQQVANLTQAFQAQHHPMQAVKAGGAFRPGGFLAGLLGAALLAALVW
jgi:hypothetical protein